MEGTSKEFCKEYNTANGCPKGFSCPHKHTYVKCKYFFAGQCWNGQRCWFAHTLKTKTTIDEEEEKPKKSKRIKVEKNIPIVGDCFEVALTEGLRLSSSTVAPIAQTCRLNSSQDVGGWFVDIEQLGGTSDTKWYVRYKEGAMVRDGNMVQVEVMNGADEACELKPGQKIAMATRARKRL